MKNLLIPTVTGIATLAVLMLDTASAMSTPPAERQDTIQLDAGSMPLVRTMDERYQSFQIGMSHLTGGETWRTYDEGKGEGEAGQPDQFEAVREARSPANLAHTRLRTLASALGPFYVRFGGTTTNAVYFQNNDEPKLDSPPEGFLTVLTRQSWKGALDFAEAVDAKIITGFTVSDGVRDENGAWTPRHAAPWLDYTRSVGGAIYAAELFNEPNAPEPGRMPEGESAEHYARDFAIFSRFMAEHAPDVKLAGPGVATLGVPIKVPSLDHTTPEQYITASPRPSFDILSYHFYGAIAERCAPPDSPAGISADQALTDTWLARPDQKFQEHKALRDKYAPNAPIWLTETGAAACGGTRWQPTFLDTFRYLDTLARLSKQGLDAIVTHALISGSNGIIDEKTFQPNASYWAALLWRRLMGTRILDAGSGSDGLHIYAHCQRNNTGGVTVLAINLQKTEAKLSLSGHPHHYALTARELNSKTVKLNDHALQLDQHDSLPAINGVELKTKQVNLSPSSINFLVIQEAENPVCQ